MPDIRTLRVVFERTHPKFYPASAPYRDAIEVPLGTPDVEIQRQANERFTQHLATMDKQASAPPAPPPTASALLIQRADLLRQVADLDTQLAEHLKALQV